MCSTKVCTFSNSVQQCVCVQKGCSRACCSGPVAGCGTCTLLKLWQCVLSRWQAHYSNGRSELSLTSHREAGADKETGRLSDFRIQKIKLKKMKEGRKTPNVSFYYLSVNSPLSVQQPSNRQATMADVIIYSKQCIKCNTIAPRFSSFSKFNR